jgi:hypothetical protein
MPKEPRPTFENEKPKRREVRASGSRVEASSISVSRKFVKSKSRILKFWT